MILFSGVNPTEVQQMVEDHLKQLILKHFDPKKADTIFTEGEGVWTVLFSFWTFFVLLSIDLKKLSYAVCLWPLFWPKDVSLSFLSKILFIRTSTWSGCRIMISIKWFPLQFSMLFQRNIYVAIRPNFQKNLWNCIKSRLLVQGLRVWILIYLFSSNMSCTESNVLLF